MNLTSISVYQYVCFPPPLLVHGNRYNNYCSWFAIKHRRRQYKSAVIIGHSLCAHAAKYARIAQLNRIFVQYTDKECYGWHSFDCNFASQRRVENNWQLSDRILYEWLSHEIFDAGLARWSRRKVHSLMRTDNWNGIGESPTEII